MRDSTRRGGSSGQGGRGFGEGRKVLQDLNRGRRGELHSRWSSQGGQEQGKCRLARRGGAWLGRGQCRARRLGTGWKEAWFALALKGLWRRHIGDWPDSFLAGLFLCFQIHSLASAPTAWSTLRRTILGQLEPQFAWRWGCPGTPTPAPNGMHSH